MGTALEKKIEEVKTKPLMNILEILLKHLLLYQELIKTYTIVLTDHLKYVSLYQRLS